MKIADDFDAIRQRLHELTATKEPTCQVSRDVAVGQSVIELYADAEADVSSNYFGGPFFGGMIVA